MNRLQRSTMLISAGFLLMLTFSTSYAGLVVDAEGYEFTLPQEVAGYATLTLTNTGGPVLQYGITSTIRDGFQAQYYRNRAGAAPAFGELVFQRQDATINFNWQANGPQNGLGNDSFGVKWEGVFIAPENGRYAFRTTTDDGVRFFVDGQRFINDWVNHNETSRDWAGNLSFGPHRIRMEYYEDRNNAVAKLLWQPPGAQLVPMPGRSEKGWLTCEPSHGNLAVGAPAEVEVMINTTSMEADGDYLDTLIISSNDRDNPTIRIPVSVHVTPWQPGEVEPSAWGVARNMQVNARESSQLTLRSVGRGNYEYEATIEGGDRGWLSVTPSSGSIGPGRSGIVTLNFNSTARNQGIYNATLVLTGNNERNPVTRIPVTMTIGVPFGTVFGEVTSLRSGDPVADAIVGLTGFGYATRTNNEGAFELSVPVSEHQLWVTSNGYLRYESDAFQVENGGRSEINPELRQASFSPGLQELELFLAPEDTMTFPLAVRNRGNGPVSWMSEIVFSQEHVLRQWSEQFRFNISREGLNNERINGVEFVDGNFYVTGGSVGADEEGHEFGRVYVFDSEGAYVREFNQFNDPTTFGMRDLAWDGELLWGADAGVVYGFDLEGNLQNRFSPQIGECRALTFDPEAGVLWAADNRGDMYRIDREGRVVERVGDPGGRKFGFAWFADDPDGYPLYMFTNDNGAHVISIQKYSPEANELRFLVDLEGTNADRAGGLGITGSWDPYSWSILAQMNSNSDAIAVYNLASRTDWINLPVTEGTIDGGQLGNIEVEVNTIGLLVNARYEASIHFTHDGEGGEITIPLVLNVGEEGGVSQRVISLERGWNLVSTNISPDGRDDFTGLLSPLTDEGTLILAKDGHGNFFWPAREFDNIGSWNEKEGYWLKVNASTQITFTGEMVPMDTPIDLDAGWNTISYLPRISAGADVVLSSIAEELVIARDGSGRFYLPAFNFSDMDPMRQGEGYQVRLTEAAELVYSFNGNASNRQPRYSSADSNWLRSLVATGLMHNLLVQTSLPAGTRIEALTPMGSVGGRAVVGADGLAGLTLWGDDPTTTAIDGFKASDAPVLKLVDGDVELQFSVKEGSALWSDGGMGVVALSGANVPTEFAISSAYPNPFNNALHIAFSLAESGRASLRVFDLAGREAATLVTGNLNAGAHRAEWIADGVPSGIYMVMLESGSKKVSQKVLLLK